MEPDSFPQGIFTEYEVTHSQEKFLGILSPCGPLSPNSIFLLVDLNNSNLPIEFSIESFLYEIFYF